ncbi:MAG: carboxypeptidase regulatory-like domain-containing protein, partial [Anaerolineales bacterium]|nr:carboxypeptidase regulatory-like domain-containing protein [Anaerolineales bacterium]
MGITQAKTKRWSLIALVLLISLTAGTLLFAAPEVQARVNLITGVVTDPAGNLPPAGSRVILVSPDGTTHGEAAVDPATGAFDLGPVVSGNYILQAWPPFGAGLTPSLPQFISMVGLPIDLGDVPLTEPQITGTVYEPDGLTPADSLVHLFLGDEHYQSTLAIDGEIQIGGLISGTYGVIAEPTGTQPFYYSQPAILTVRDGMTQTVEFSLNPANAVGFVTDPQGLPIPGAKVRILGTVHHTYQEDETNDQGFFNFGELPDDTYVLVAEAPWWAGGLIDSSVVTFHVPPAFNDLGNVALRQAPKILTGHVETNTGVGVSNALVIANRIGLPGHHEALTDAAGNYFMRLGGGLWSITVEPTALSDPNAWINPDPPQIIHFDHDLQPEFKQVHFEVLTADSTVTGAIEMPDGSVPPFPVTVSLRNAEGIGRSVEMELADGSFSLMVPHGNYLLHIQPDHPGYFGPPPRLVEAPESDTLDLGPQVLVEKDAAITGRVVDEHGDGVGGVHVSAWTRDHLGTNTITNP